MWWYITTRRISPTKLCISVFTEKQSCPSPEHQNQLDFDSVTCLKIFDTYLEPGSTFISGSVSIWACFLQIVLARSAAMMMFCTTFLSAPSEDLGCEGGGGGFVGPGSCLSSLHCLVLPQEELYTSFPDLTAPLSVCSDRQACSLVGKTLLDVSMTASGERDGVCVWERVRWQRSRSASLSPSQPHKSLCNENGKGMCYSWVTCGYLVSLFIDIKTAMVMTLGPNGVAPCWLIMIACYRLWCGVMPQWKFFTLTCK